MAQYSKGRCAGCGVTGQPNKVRVHTLVCPDFIALYRSDAARALDPEAEYARWHAQDKAGERENRVAAAIAGNASRRAEQHDRFARLPDILEDE